MTNYNFNLQRGKLIGENGPGSLYTVPSGDSFIISGINKWFDKEQHQLAEDEFIFKDKRLKALLGVSNYRIPPDFREPLGVNSDKTNTDLKIPVFRFPLLHYCSNPACGSFKELASYEVNSEMFCDKCKKRQKFKQFPIVVACENGHLTDFPYKSFIHNDLPEPNMQHDMYLKRTGSNVSNWTLKCSCGKNKKLMGLTGLTNKNELSVIQKEITGYTCEGKRPWSGTSVTEVCNSIPVAIMKNTLTLYSPNQISILRIPLSHDFSTTQQYLFNYLKQTPTGRELVYDLKDNIKVSLERLTRLSENITKYSGAEIQPVSQEDIDKVMSVILNEGNEDLSYSLNDIHDEEFSKLKLNYFSSNELVVQRTYSSNDDIIKNVSMIKRLQEICVQTGFSRLSYTDTSSESSDISSDFSNLYDKSDDKIDWLPAKILYGEGIFLEFNSDKLNKWAEQEEVKTYFKQFEKHMDINTPDSVSSIFILIHSLSHALINELSIVSGYSKSSIKERIYTTQKNEYGLLIYTTTSDKAGTYGGLVRNGEPERLNNLLNSAFHSIQWCSSDPVCSELGHSIGQGLGNRNGAACHNCMYLPETSCSYRNTFLDRTFLIGHKNINLTSNNNN